MSDVTTSATETSDAPRLGLLSRMVGVIFSPKATYASIAAHPKWFGVLALTLVIGAAAFYVIMSSPDMQDAIIDQQLRAMAAGGREVPPEAEAQIERFIGYAPIGYAIGILLFGGVILAAFAGIVTLVLTTLMGGNAKFRQVYTVSAHSTVVSTLALVFSAAMMAAGIKPTGVQPPGANLGVFAPGLEENSFGAVFLGSIDLILIWATVNFAIGLGVLYRRRTGPIATALLTFYVLYALLIGFVRSRV